jgi:hypothetical protein
MFAETTAWLTIGILQLSLIGGSLICFHKRSVAQALTSADGGFGNNNHVNLFSL